MPIQLNSPGWKIRRAGASRGAARDAAVDLPGLPPEFLTDESRVAEEVVLEPAPATRGREAVAGGLDFSYDLEPGQTAVLAITSPRAIRVKLLRNLRKPAKTQERKTRALSAQRQR